MSAFPAGLGIALLLRVHTVRYSLLAALIAASGCATEAPQDSILEGDTDDTAMLAQSGRFVTTMLPLTDGCAMGVELDPPDFVAFEASDDGQHFQFDAQGQPVECDAAGDGNFECAVELPDSDFFESASMTLSGRWISADRFEGDLDFRIACEGENCPLLEAALDVELPCSMQAAFVATRALGEDFEARSGDYSYEITPAIEGISTCAGDALGVLPDVVVVQDNEGTGDFLVDDGLGEPIDCSIEEGAIDCDRFFELEEASLSFSSVISGRWTSADQAEGILEVTVECQDEQGCGEAEASFGELPCVAYHGIELSAATTPN